MENSMRVPQKIKLLYDSAIPLLSRYPKELNTRPQRDSCIPTLKIVLVIIAKKWNQPKCPSKEKCINKVWYIHRMEYYAAWKKEINPVTHCSTDKLWGHYDKWNNPVTRRQTHVWLSSFCSPQTTTALLTGYIPQYKIKV